MEYPIEYSDVRDEALPQRDGSIARVKKYTFFLGKFGPFIERIPLELDQTAEIRRRVTLLKTHLGLMHT